MQLETPQVVEPTESEYVAIPQGMSESDMLPPPLAQPKHLAQAATLVTWNDPVLVASRLELTSGEQLLGVLRPHWRGVIGPLLWAVVTGVIFGWMASPTLSVSGGIIGGFLTAGTISMRTIANLIGRRYFITNRRVVSSHEWFWTEEVSIPIDRFQIIKGEQGVIARLFNAGTVKLVSAAQSLSSVTQLRAEQKAQRSNPFRASTGMVNLRGILGPHAVRNYLQQLVDSVKEDQEIDTQPKEHAQEGGWGDILSEVKGWRMALQSQTKGTILE